MDINKELRIMLKNREKEVTNETLLKYSEIINFELKEETNETKLDIETKENFVNKFLINKKNINVITNQISKSSAEIEAAYFIFDNLNLEKVLDNCGPEHEELYKIIKKIIKEKNKYIERKKELFIERKKELFS